MPWMPKGRYAIMRRYMPRVGTLGLDMMTRTCTVQVNLDYASEADMVRKLRVSLALQPLATALFANSPFTEGRPNGFLSYRAHVWTDTDHRPHRHARAVLRRRISASRATSQWLLDSADVFRLPRRPLRRRGRPVVPRLHGRATIGQQAGRATVGDFADHMTTVFTDVRLKRFLEMRGADAGTPEMMLAQSALWVGLLYDERGARRSGRAHSCAAPGWPTSRRCARAVPRAGARDTVAGRNPARPGARGAWRSPRDGLRARARRDAAGRDEAIYLAPLHGDCRRARRRRRNTGSRAITATWRGDVRPHFRRSRGLRRCSDCVRESLPSYACSASYPA